MKRALILLSVGIFILAIFPRCAKVVAPTGGPKDTLPPVMTGSIPQMNATNFKGKKIVFEFNEYIQLKDVQQKLLVSPPLKNKPQINPKGKRFEVEFTDTLKENTTYTIYLGDAVADNNEGNPIKSFEFAFSTGSEVDTLMLSGSVENSFTGKSVEGALVMLYNTFVDSLPYLELPVHIAKTNKEGKFTVNNLKFLDYKIVTITDANSNYKYNQGIEEIAFLEEPIEKQQLIDSASKQKIVLRSFIEVLPQQVITSTGRPDRKQLELGFSRKPLGGFKLLSVDYPNETNWYLTEPDLQGDTVKIWLTSDMLASIDTLKLIAQYQKTDSLNILFPQADTLKFVYVDIAKNEKETKPKKDKRDDEKERSGFKLETSVTNGKVAKADEPFEIILPTPAIKVDASKILIFNEKDSVMESTVELKLDSINPRIYKFYKDWKPAVKYKALILPGAFENINSVLNDSVKLAFLGADPENFGSLIIKTDSIATGIVAELLSDKGVFVARKSATGSNPIVFTYIEAGKYKLRFIEDLNRNGVWDTGNYLKKIQPERVFEFTEGKNKGEINIRTNWESEIQFSIPKP